MSTAGPDYERVAAVLVCIELRLVTEDNDKTVNGDEEGADADRGLLQGVDRGTGGRGLLDRRAS